MTSTAVSSSVKRMSVTRPMRMPLLRTGVSRLTPGASGKRT